MVIDDLTLPYFEKMLAILRPWSIYFDWNSTSRIDSIDKDQVNHLLESSSEIECIISLIQRHRNQFNLAENYCQLALSHARLYEGKEEVKTDLLRKAFRTFYALRRDQGNYVDALTFAEEKYNCVAVVYNPVHPEVQEAASQLIECLTLKGDLYNAERFAQATLDSLKDPKNGLDQQGKDVSDGNYNLASVIYKQKSDLVKAEMLSRESHRILSQLYNHDHQSLGSRWSQLASILQAQGKLGCETKELFERSLALETKHSGPDGDIIAVAIANLGNFYNQLADSQQTAVTKRNYLRLSICKYKEAVRIYTKIHGPENSMTIKLSSDLSSISLMLSKA